MRLHPIAASIALVTTALGAHAGVIHLNLNAAEKQLLVASASNSLLVNGDFESSNVAAGSYNYVDYSRTAAVAADGWTFAGYSGVANQSTDWGGVAAGSAVAFLQSVFDTSLPTLTQSFSSSAAALSISFNLANRPNYGVESLRVLLDGIDLTPTLLTATGADWNGYTLQASGLTGSKHTVSFVGVNSTGSADAALFLDQVSVVVANATVPEPGTLALVGAALAGAGVLRRRRG